MVNDQPDNNNSERRMLDLLKAISLEIAQTDSINNAFAQVLTHFCRYMKWPLGHVFIWSEEDHAFVSSKIWYVDDPAAYALFQELSEMTRFRPGEGTIGRVLERNEPLMILDLQADSTFLRKLPVGQGRLHAYLAFPVKVEHAISAVIEFFSPESIAPDRELLSIIDHVNTLLGLAWQNQQMVTRLRQKEAQLADVQRTAHIGHWEWVISEDEVIWSPEIYRIFGFQPAGFELSYQRFLDAIPAEELDYVQSNVRDAYENGRPFNYFHHIIRPDGAMRVVHSRGQPIFDQAGNIKKLVGTVQDMTDLKEAELKLAQTVKQLSTLMEIGQAVSATLDLNAIYNRVLTLLRPVLGAEVVILFLHNEDMLEIVAIDQEITPEIRGHRITIDTGIAGAVWQSAQSLNLKGDACVERLLPGLKDLTGCLPEAMLAVPVRWQNEAIGVMEAGHRDADAFNEEDLRLLEMAATWTAIAINNARQYEILQRRLIESDAIAAISTALTKTFDLDELLQLIVTHVQDILPSADWTTIHLLQPNTNQLALVASAGLDVNPADYFLNIGEGIAGLVMLEGNVINVADLQNDSRRLPIDLTTNARSLLVAPVESRFQRLGTISVQCANPNIFTPEDERLIKILGVQAGIAIDNARLYENQKLARYTAERQRERIRLMARRVVKAQEDERTRIARELHDESGQSLTSLKISLDLMRSSIPVDMAPVHENLNGLIELVDKTMTNLRLLSHNLRPPGLDAYGLDAALAGLCQDFESHTSMKVSYCGTDLPELSRLSALSLYRFAQEALTNTAKYAEATEVKVVLTWETEQDVQLIKLSVTDDGRGFSPPDLENINPAQGTGLVGMMERLEMVDGKLHIVSTKGQGSVLTAVVPYSVEEA